MIDMDYHRSLSQRSLHQCCMEEPVEEVDDLLSSADYDSPGSVADRDGNTFLHKASEGGQVEVVKLLITKYNCKVDSTNKYGQTPMHLACAGGHSNVVEVLVSEYEANIKVKDKNGNEPLHIAAQNGHTKLINTLILKYSCEPTSTGQNGQTLLHLSSANGHMELLETLLSCSDVSIVSIDDNGNTPLHLASQSGQEECVKMLLQKHNAPVFVRNKAGKSAQNLSKGKCKLIFKQYLDSPQRQVQDTNEELHTLSLKKYSSQQITRVFVLGDIGSGKSSLIQAFKRRGPLKSHSLVDEKVVAPRTSGIVPSYYDSKKVGRIIYYDFAGDREYYSSHSAIVEMVFQSPGNDFFFVVLNLCNSIDELKKQLGYWLSFVSYMHKLNTDTGSKTKTLVVCSHVDLVGPQEVSEKVKCLEELSTEFMESNNLIGVINTVQINCCLPQDVRTLKEIIQKETKDTIPCCLSYEARLLHGVLEKYFSNVVACKLEEVIDHVSNNTHIHLPSEASKLYPISRELQNAGLLLIIGHSENKLQDYLLLMDVASLTCEVHEKIFSEKARQKLTKTLSAKIGILPESCIQSILPEHITKECLVQLQYCHEFSRVEIKLDDCTVVPSSSSKDHLLYFPDLCKLESASADSPNSSARVSDFNFNMGWCAKCIGKFDYFPPRFLHTLLLRLAFSFGLPIACSGNEEESDLSTSIRQDNRRCTMWKNGIRWMMEEGVECICEVVDDCKGIVVITRAKKPCDELITILRKIIDKVLLAKAEFCEVIRLRHFLLNSDNPCAYKDNTMLYAIEDVEKVMKKRNKRLSAVSISGTGYLDSSRLSVLRTYYTYWGLFFPITMTQIMKSIEDITEWEELGYKLNLPSHKLREICVVMAHIDLTSKKEAMITEWMSSSPACWWLLVKALEEMELYVAAKQIHDRQGAVVEVQKRLIETDPNCKLDDDFLESFADVVGDHWHSIATLLSISPGGINGIESEREKAIQVLKEWQLSSEATYGQLYQKLQTISIFHC